MVFLGAAWCLAAGPRPLLAAVKHATSRSAVSATASGVLSRDPYQGVIVLEPATGRVLLEDRADAKGYPASVLKLMDLLIILEKVERRELSWQEPVGVSAKACLAAPSKVWLSPKEKFPLDEMLYALMVHSANDVAVALAEKVGGSTDGFIQLMNRRAAELGMTNTVFHSVNGLPPARGQEHDVTTARDLAILCREVLKHSDALRYTSTRQHMFRANVPGKNVDMRNHNHLLDRIPGCDGLKTGYILAAGYSIAVTATRNGQRVLVVVLGSKSSQTRDARAAELVDRGFAALTAARTPRTGAYTAAPGTQPARAAAKK